MNCFGRTGCHCEILLFVVYGMTLNTPDAKKKNQEGVQVKTHYVYKCMDDSMKGK